jgi:N,N'-diacetyllegionaminate synthase
VAGTGRPVILSTGASTLDEVRQAKERIENIWRTENISQEMAILHCVATYPAPLKEVNLKCLQALRNLNVTVGYSDHTMGMDASVLSVALGARIIEKHFTMDRNLPGPDHRASLEPNELKSMVTAIRNIENAMGTGIKKPSPSEVKNMAVARKSIVAAKPIAKGELFTQENLTVKRPGTGISPVRWDELLKMKASRDFAADELIYP